jgi:GT2 family glycosyltransferase
MASTSMPRRSLRPSRTTARSGASTSRDSFASVPRRAYDSIVFADVLEHLRDPDRLISTLKDRLVPTGKIFISVPNIGYVGVIAGLMTGEFKYRPTGLLDEGHVRFFTRASIVALARRHGLEPTAISVVRRQPRETEFRGQPWEAIPPEVLRGLAALPDAFSYQFVLEVREGAARRDFPAQGSEEPGRIEFETQLFWDDGRGSLDEARSCVRGVALGANDQQVEFEIPPLRQAPTILRLDPSDRPGYLQLSQLKLCSADGTALWQWDGAPETLGSTREILFLPETPAGTLLSTGPDPRILLPVPRDALQALSSGGRLTAVMGSPAPEPGQGEATSRVHLLEVQARALASEHSLVQQELRSVRARVAELESAARLAGSRESGSRVRRELLSLGRDLAPRSVGFEAIPKACLRRVENNTWVSTGIEPSFELRSLTGVLPAGRCVIDLELELLDEPRSGHASLVVDTGDAADATVRIPLGKPQDGALHALIRLPPVVRSMELQPLGQYGRFRLGGVRITEIGKLRAGLHRLRPRISAVLEEPTALPAMLQSAAQLYRKEGIGGLKQALMATPADLDDTYGAWVRAYDVLSEEDARQIQEAIARLPARPFFSVVMIVGEATESWLQGAVKSVQTQLYPHWELCLAADAVPKPQLAAFLKELTKTDSRIRVLSHEQTGSASEATNAALAQARGDYVAFLSPEDELTRHALYMVAEELASYPEADVVYSDEDGIDGQGQRRLGHFKPDWNPELLWSTDYVGNLSVLRTSLVRELGGMRPGLDDARHHDLLLRASARSSRGGVRHIPHVLYHRRAGQESPASRPEASAATCRAVSEFLGGASISAKVSAGPVAQSCRVTLALPQQKPAVSLVIPTRDRVELLRRCVTSIRALTDYDPYEIVVVDNQSRDPDALRYLDEIQATGVARVLRYNRPFNYSAINNWAITQTSGEFVGLLNNDLEVIGGDWLSEMVGHAGRPGIGAVGAKLLYPDNTIQHAGVIGGIRGVAGHIFTGAPSDAPGHGNRALLLQELSIVTAACLVIRRETYQKVGGLDEKIEVAFNDVDLCLKLRAAGFRNIWTPFALLYHLESATRGSDSRPEARPRFLREMDLMKGRWGASLTQDPFYNPNLSLDSSQMELAWPPRTTKPWRRLDDGDG